MYTLAVREVASQLARDMLPIRGSRTRPRDRHQIVQRSSQERGRPAPEQNIRSSVAETIQCLGLARITRNQSGDLALLDHAQPLVEAIQPAR